MEARTTEAEKLYMDGTGTGWKDVSINHRDAVRLGINDELKVWYSVTNNNDLSAHTIYRDSNGRRIDDEQEENDPPGWKHLEFWLFPDDLSDIEINGGRIKTEYLQGKVCKDINNPGEPTVHIKKIIKGELFVVCLENLYAHLSDVKALDKEFFDVGANSSNPVEQQSRGNNKITLSELKPFAEKLQKVEKDQDVIAARLYDEHGARHWQLVEMFSITLPVTSQAKDPQKAKETITRRKVEKGRKTLKRRSEDY